jgi:hypothetical protein
MIIIHRKRDWSISLMKKQRGECGAVNVELERFAKVDNGRVYDDIEGTHHV